jgi:ribosome-interacting GTPase 1
MGPAQHSFDGHAQALVSAGNTGACILACARHFRAIKGIRKTALASVYPRQTEYPGQDRLALLLELFPSERLPMLAISAGTGQGMEELRRAAWPLIHMMRVYGKPAGQKPDTERPFALPAGSTVEDFAAHVHRDLPGKLKSARIWGTSARFEGQSVDRDHVLADKDVVELHT